ncbi:MAG TPA: hypothetical protein ENJ56_05900, partial [Anaerolineae bacterium]|nr:hypothetical protein [Anaerolineae bacterium]
MPMCYFFVIKHCEKGNWRNCGSTSSKYFWCANSNAYGKSCKNRGLCMISNADLRHAQHDLKKLIANSEASRTRSKYKRLLILVIWLLCALIAFFTHPHLQATPLPQRVFWALFGLWSVPTWSLLGAPLWQRVQVGGSLAALYGGVYGLLGVVATIWAMVYQLWLRAPASAKQWSQVQQEKHRREQGQLTIGEAVDNYAFPAETDGIPLVQVTHKRKQPIVIGVPYQREMGHTIVIAPTRAGKGLHLTEVLRHWQHAALVIDPKGEQCERTAGIRQLQGAVYNVPQHTLDLSQYYDWTNRNDLTELHKHLIRPDADRQTIFA